MNLALFAATALPFVVSPGAAFTLTIAASASGDRWAPLKVWAGTTAGVFIIAAVAGFSGLAEIITHSEVARTIFGIAGGGVLITLGVATFIKARRPAPEKSATEPQNKRLMLWSFLVVLTNVKALSVYVLVVPSIQGAGVDGPLRFLIFAVVHMAMQLIWLLLLGLAVRKIPLLATSARARTVLLLIAAFTLVLLGVITLVQTIT